jgi:hypothetical protein
LDFSGWGRLDGLRPPVPREPALPVRLEGDHVVGLGLRARDLHARRADRMPGIARPLTGGRSATRRRMAPGGTWPSMTYRRSRRSDRRGGSPARQAVFARSSSLVSTPSTGKPAPLTCSAQPLQQPQLGSLLTVSLARRRSLHGRSDPKRHRHRERGDKPAAGEHHHGRLLRTRRLGRSRRWLRRGGARRLRRMRHAAAQRQAGP